jgi:hypothetical protein
MKGRAWSVEDRQRFADGDVLRASTVPVRKSVVVDDFAAAMDELDEGLLVCGVENPEVCESCT